MEDLVRGTVENLAYVEPKRSIKPGKDGWYRLRPGIAAWVVHLSGILLLAGMAAWLVLADWRLQRTWDGLPNVMFLAAFSAGVVVWTGYPMFIRRVRWKAGTLSIRVLGRAEVSRSFDEVIYASESGSAWNAHVIRFQDGASLKLSSYLLRGVPQLCARLNEATASRPSPRSTMS